MPLRVDAASCRVGRGFDAYDFASDLPAHPDAQNTATSGIWSWGFAVSVSFASRYAKRQDAASTFSVAIRPVLRRKSSRILLHANSAFLVKDSAGRGN
jgi:hypothetical protein